MAKLKNYKGTVKLVSGITQNNNQTYPLMEANAIQVDENDKRLDVELNDINESIQNTNNALIDAVPVGTVLEWMSTNTPKNYLQLNGQSLNIADYPELYAVIGKTYGGTNTTFKLPNQNAGANVTLNYYYIIKAK